MESINPVNGHLIQKYDVMNQEEVYSIIGVTQDAFLSWSRIGFDERSQYLYKVAKVLEEHKEEYASLITDEMGKVYKESVAEIEKCIWVCEYYAENASSFLKEQIVEIEDTHSFITYNPLGTVLAIMPWNFPFWQVFRFAAPALMAGNTALLKHAGNVCGSALAIEDVFRKAGMPDNVFRALLITSEQVVSVIEHQAVKAITLTGSTNAGRAVASSAGRSLKKTVLELGGSDAYVILEDADIQKAVEACVISRLINAGQSCIAAKRFIVHEAVYNEFLSLFIKKMSATHVGNPYDKHSDVGPMANIRLRDALHQQVQESISKGAKCVLGGNLPESEGAYYPPTILVNVSKGMPAYDEELFGPVASVIKVSNEDEAINIANDSVFGLGAALFTRDAEKGTRIARDYIQSGACFVNSFVKSDPRLPFGGIKESGYGRELSDCGIKEFVNIKSISISH